MSTGHRVGGTTAMGIISGSYQRLLAGFPGACRTAGAIRTAGKITNLKSTILHDLS